MEEITEIAAEVEINQSEEHQHQLWVNLSAHNDGNIFANLSEVLKQMFASESEEMDEEFFDIILPSNENWRTKVYYKLVEQERRKDRTMLDPSLQPEDPVKLHDWNIVPKQNVVCQIKIGKNEKKSKRHKRSVTWNVSDIAKAGCLLHTPPREVKFEDEQEMRRVYTLIYDVFRYKNVLSQALNDVSFYQIFPKLHATQAHVWLLLYDLYHRSFKKRESSVASIASKLFDIVGLSLADNAIWTQKIKLAAAISRLRIKHNALSLSELLPARLKDERVAEHAKNNPVTCWINTIKVERPDELCKEIEEKFDLKLVAHIDDLHRNNYKWDRHCPQIVAFHSSMRSKLARSHFVRNHLLIVQDKSFCLGAATFVKIVVDLELSGSVVQTHVNSPRTTAYLANLLSHNEKINKLLAFSAGRRKNEYENYFHQLGMTNIKIFADRLIDLPADANYMEEVVAVFATPPNSYSAVADPVDLVCSRGGDLSMLEALTESQETQEGKERVQQILDEQRRTLRFAMSRPQIQFVLYETHSELEAENNGMVNKTLRDINKIAKLQHAALQGKLPGLPNEVVGDEGQHEPEKDSILADSEGDGPQNTLSTPSKFLLENQETILDNIEIPDTDLFDVPAIPSLCPNENTCFRFKKEGCFLALLQRKSIIRLDDKYMIQMAENRGLFGNTSSANTTKTKTNRTTKKKEKKTRPRRKLNDAEVTSLPSLDDSNAISLQDESVNESLEEKFIDRGTDQCCQRPLRNILGQLTSAQIRRIISPFYRDVTVNYPPKKNQSEMTNPKLLRKMGAVKRKSSEMVEKPAEKIVKLSYTVVGHNTSGISDQSSWFSGRKRRLGKAKEKQMVDRLCLPTQNCMMRHLTEDTLLDGKRRKSPMEYCKPFFICQLCKKRNEGI